jgi:hypothetical protein
MAPWLHFGKGVTVMTLELTSENTFPGQEEWGMAFKVEGNVNEKM